MEHSQMPDDLSILRTSPFDSAVAKLEDLMTQSGRVFLIGAGCSKCAGLPLTAELTTKVLENSKIDSITKEILSLIAKEYAGTTDANIEDYLSELVDFLAIIERRTFRGTTKKTVDLCSKSYTVDQLRDGVEQIKRAIADVIDQNVSIETHWQFIKAVHRPIRPGKAIGNQSVDYLVLNYDTLIEDALALEKVPFSDGLDGGVSGWWNPSTFDQEGLMARVFKLHGSINWSEFADDPLPRRLAKTLSVFSKGNSRIVIWPASTKYRETQRDPYAQLASRARDVLRPMDGMQRVLAICGYRFGDSHVNIEIDRALRISEGRLTIVVFTSEENLNGKLADWYRDSTIREQVLVFGKRGFWHGDTVSPSSTDLPWWKFENITRLLGGER